MMDLPAFREHLYRFILCLTSATSNIAIYPSNHPFIKSGIGEAYAELTEMLRGRREIKFVLLRNLLVSYGVPLKFKGPSWRAFLHMLKKKKINQITFYAGLPLNQLEQFIIDLASDRKDTLYSTAFIKFGNTDSKDEGKKGEFDDYGESNDDFNGVLDLGMLEPNRMVKDLYQNIMVDGTIRGDVVSEIVTVFLEQIQTGGSPLTMLASLKSVDEYTFTHAVNVGILTMSLAESLGFSGSHLKDIGTAALLHDVGKIQIPEEILQKKGALDSGEREIMESHSINGARQLMKIEGLPKLALIVALEHHLKYDGGGYPHVKGKWQTNIVSQIVSIADVFDALRTKRPYREAMPPGEVERILRLGSGVSFNPFLLEHFLEGIKNKDLQSEHV
ncbi:MAG: HD domain-containing protein [Syntrophales bacterium]|jgi:putative nucleotidyltransferase with HDIG domain|nr:HD domain-containing protein [Syntrophales bacterium]